MKLHWTHLTWRKASEAAKTYRASTDTHSYTVDHNGTSWCLRVWEKGVTGLAKYETGDMMADLQQLADSHASSDADNRKDDANRKAAEALDAVVKSVSEKFPVIAEWNRTGRTPGEAVGSNSPTPALRAPQRSIRRPVLFGKSYVWGMEDGALTLRPDMQARIFFPRTEARQQRAYEQLARTGLPDRVRVGDRVTVTRAPFGRVGFTGRLDEVDEDDTLQPYKVVGDDGRIVWATRVRPVLTLKKPRQLPVRAAVVGASVVTVAALAVALAPSATAPARPDMERMPFTVSSGPVEPYTPTPEPRTSMSTNRDGARPKLLPSPAETIAKPSRAVREERQIHTPPTDIRISFYRDCTGHAQECIDDGALTMYGGVILAGHNYMGYQWLSRVPVGRKVIVVSGPLVGTYKVYGHMRISRQGGAIPSFGTADLVLQACEGSGTGFSLLHRV